MRVIKLCFAILAGILLVGCASDSLKSPCPDYGASCEKTPVNSWDTSDV